MSCESEKYCESYHCAFHEGEWGSGGIGAHMLNLGPGWRCGELNNLTTITTFSLLPPPNPLQGKVIISHLNRRLGGL